jgi:hypothetical protein
MLEHSTAHNVTKTQYHTIDSRFNTDNKFNRAIALVVLTATIKIAPIRQAVLEATTS